MQKKITKHPKFDVDGNITLKTFRRIENWTKDWEKFFVFLKECFSLEYGAVEENGDEVTFITGGWSTNENVIRAIKKNRLFMALSWQSSHRGGKYIFKKIKGKRNV